MRVDVSKLPRIESRVFLGGEVVHADDDGSDALVRFVPPEGLRNPNDTLQGGAVAALIDDVVSMATYFAGKGRPFVTTNLACYYLRPVPMGVPLLARSTLIKVGKTQALFDAVLMTEGSDAVLVKATQTQQFFS